MNDNFTLQPYLPELDDTKLMTESELEEILENPAVINQTADNILIRVFREGKEKNVVDGI